MDSEHRHELKENDLEVFLLNFRQWWIKHGRKTLLTILAVVMAVAIWRWKWTSDNQKHENGWAQLAVATAPETSLMAAASADSPGLKNLGRLKGADLWLDKATISKTGEPISIELREQMLDRAKQTYQDVLNDQGADVVFQLNALLGLASIAESQFEWDRAHAYYQQIMNQSQKHYPAHHTWAKQRQNLLARLRIPMEFAPAPVIPPEASAVDDAAVPLLETIDEVLIDDEFLDATVADDQAQPDSEEQEDREVMSDSGAIGVE